MNNKTLEKVIEKYNKIRLYNPKTEDVQDYREDEVKSLVTIVNQFLITEALCLLGGTVFILNFDKLKIQAENAVNLGLTCEVDKEGKFIVTHNNKRIQHNLISPQDLVKKLAENGLNKKQSILAELILADETNFILINLAIRDL